MDVHLRVECRLSCLMEMFNLSSWQCLSAALFCGVSWFRIKQKKTRRMQITCKLSGNRGAELFFFPAII